MSAKLQSVKGMNDLLPAQSPYWQFIEQVLREIAAAYAYDEIRTPVLEKTALFVQSIGEQTDIVEKEMFAFEDTGGEFLCMRPECTASVVRAGVQHGLFHNTQTRLWYMGPMFRRERPQKGRYRQFSQFGMEAIGWPGAEADVEVMLAGARIWKALGVKDVHLYLNSLGSDACRVRYRAALVDYLAQHFDALDADSRRRLDSNPLRILDSKNPGTRLILENAPVINDYLDDVSNDHFSQVCSLLDSADIAYTIDSSLVRGLDYYTSTVFEWKTGKLGAQNTVCAGGRYDDLVERRGGRSTPACGFAMGMERLVELLIEENNTLEIKPLDIWFITLDDAANNAAFPLAETLRDSGLTVAMNHGVGKLKSQLKKADVSGAKFALILGQAELEQGLVQVKPLRGQFESQDVVFGNVLDVINS
ncbi:MAG: histidine--tRNA ligase [Proteobacteria bacterium]|nr:histidine--tRNA ligase [Pseudomonadota bacterium]